MINSLPKLTYLQSSLASLDKSWQDFLFFNCFKELQVIDNKLQQLSTTQIIYPPSPLIFNALLHTPFNKVKVVILGQDPYHGEGEANGLAFAVNRQVKLPPSLRNIFKELAKEYNTNTQNLTGDKLVSWADQGVLLLNASLTVIKDQANSLADLGWQEITNKIIYELSHKNAHLVFILWGNFARQKVNLIDPSSHLILVSAHPSPLSANRGFFGCNHFKLANQYLVSHGHTPINWL